LPGDLPGHAQEFETAFALACFSRKCPAESDIKEQVDQKTCPRVSVTGKEFIKRIVERVASYVREMIDGKRIATIPDYYP
jgi:hypothetical protein